MQPRICTLESQHALAQVLRSATGTYQASPASLLLSPQTRISSPLPLYGQFPAPLPPAPPQSANTLNATDWLTDC